MLKQCTIVLITSVTAITSLAQNLVPNPSFEEYLECPQSTGELVLQVVNWYSWQYSPDFFHPCNNDGLGTAGVPQNAFGHQWPITGDGYAGVFTFADFDVNIREYMAAPLNMQLETGISYYMMFHVSLGDSGEVITRKCATNNLGMRFFKDPTYSHFPPVNAFNADNFAHLNSSEVITDDQNWTIIEGWFTADNTYNWVAIGNFFDDQNTTTVELNDQQRCSSVYYIENVCVATDPTSCDYLLGISRNPGYSNELKVYPNPASDILQVALDVGKLESLVLYDHLGREMLRSEQIDLSRISLNISALSKGVYVLRVKTNSQFLNKKIIIK